MAFLSKAFRMAIGGAVFAAGLAGASATLAQGAPDVYGKIEWGVWVDDDGCMHW